NIVASTLACWFVYRLSLTITESKNAALAGLALIALYPHHINWVRYISSDTAAMFFLTAAIFLFVCFKNFWLSCFLSALMLGVATITRLTCLPVVLAPLAVFMRAKHHKRLLVYGIVFSIPLLAIIGVNYAHTGKVFIATNVATNWIISAESRSDAIYYDDGKIPLTKQIMRDKDAGAALRFYLQGLRENPREWFVKRAYSLWELWGPYPLSKKGNAKEQLLIGLRFVLLCLGIVGSRKLFLTDKVHFLMLWGPIILVSVIHGLMFSVPRYTLLMEPLVIVLAIQGASVCRCKKS
ncbi:MAG: phospholipid carrier-dependent glycosyltransferase, partial [Candidatus Omnitrophica bacterium]|nr:phospholipid carrier-dependent glycosyltransferase [Candidatus Omnitrophota bacterium]